MSMRELVIGDIHGGYRALKQVLERAKFDSKKDKLICLGDVADGWSEVPECFELLLKIKNLYYVRGNHDQWLKEFLEHGKQPIIWTCQGGEATREAYLFRRPELMKEHLKFLEDTPCTYVDEQNRMFVHGGVPIKKDTNYSKQDLMWDRDLWEKRHEYEEVEEFKEVYVGHTSIYRFSHKPLNYGNVWFMDTGGGWEGVISLMDINTKEVWQSDLVKDLYPETRGRN